jgi:hypothetical protein
VTSVEEICVKCGKKFLRGIWPQSKCEQCSIAEGGVVYSLKEAKEVTNQSTPSPYEFETTNQPIITSYCPTCMTKDSELAALKAIAERLAGALEVILDVRDFAVMDCECQECTLTREGNAALAEYAKVKP